MVATADWSIAVGILTYIIALVFATIFYIKQKKISTILLIASIATYIFAIFYTWDIYEPEKNIVITMLAISAIIMLLIGKYFKQISLNKKTKLKKHPKIHLYIAGILIIIQIATMFLSISNKNIETQYTFKETIKAKQESDIIIGNVTIKNNGLISSRAQLKNLKLCSFANDSNQEYEIYYSKADIFSYAYNERTTKIDISPKEKITANIYTNIYERTPYIEKPKEEKEIILYLFETKPEDETYYSYCINANKENAIKTINLTIQ